MESITKRSVVKFLELAIAVVCIGLQKESFVANLDAYSLSAVAFGGYIIVIVGILATQFLGKPIEKRVDIFLSVLGCVLFIAAGSMVIKSYNDLKNVYGALSLLGQRLPLTNSNNYCLAQGSIGIIGGLVFLGDAFLAIVLKE